MKWRAGHASTVMAKSIYRDDHLVASATTQEEAECLAAHASAMRELLDLLARHADDLYESPRAAILAVASRHGLNWGSQSELLPSAAPRNTTALGTAGRTLEIH